MVNGHGKVAHQKVKEPRKDKTGENLSSKVASQIETYIYVWVLRTMFAKSIPPAVKQRPCTTLIRIGAVKEGVAGWRRGQDQQELCQEY